MGFEKLKRLDKEWTEGYKSKFTEVSSQDAIEQVRGHTYKNEAMQCKRG